MVALPEIGRELGYSAQTPQVVISAYAIASSGFLLLGGRAADLLGRRRMLVTGLALYAVASAAGGLATVPAIQLTSRALWGGALVFPSTRAGNEIGIAFNSGASGVVYTDLSALVRDFTFLQ